LLPEVFFCVFYDRFEALLVLVSKGILDAAAIHAIPSGAVASMAVGRASFDAHDHSAAACRDESDLASVWVGVGLRLWCVCLREAVAWILR
jgi:hypothetical protein